MGRAAAAVGLGWLLVVPPPGVVAKSIQNMQVKLALSALDVLKAKIRVVAAVSVLLRVLRFVCEKY
jgi:hypothetical protein